LSNKLRAAGFRTGVFKTGPGNQLSDVPGNLVGNLTLNDAQVQTGVTVIIPAPDIYNNKLPAACHVINGYGKTTGLLQITELGNIETPIVLTNTLSVGTAYQALVRHMLKEVPFIGIEACSVNPVICECNDGYLNDIRGLHIKEEDVLQAIEAASADFDEGSVGAGRGMSCHGLKGGIGSSSRVIPAGDKEYILGTLVLTNHAKIEELRIGGVHIGEELSQYAGAESPFKGSVIVIIATDAPLDSRQLGRICRRASSGLARTGSIIASGSGEIAIAYSTANRITHRPEDAAAEMKTIHEDLLDPFFAGTVEAVEEAVLSSLFEAKTVEGRDEHLRRSLTEVLEESGISPW